MKVNSKTVLPQDMFASNAFLKIILHCVKALLKHFFSKIQIIVDKWNEIECDFMSIIFYFNVKYFL